MSDTTKARNLRKHSTDAERTLWRLLRSRRLQGFKFRRQAPIGGRIVDFVCFEAMLVVEVDGGHHLEQSNSDEERTRWLESEGFRVLRFWNNQVLKESGAVLETIWRDLPEGGPPRNNPPACVAQVAPPLGRRAGIKTPPLPREVVSKVP